MYLYLYCQIGNFKHRNACIHVYECKTFLMISFSYHLIHKAPYMYVFIGCRYISDGLTALSHSMTLKAPQLLQYMLT